MKQKITLDVLLLLVCRAVAAGPIDKPDKTAAAHPLSRRKTWRRYRLDLQTSARLCLDLLLLPLVRLAHMGEAASQEEYISRWTARGGR